MNSAGKYRKIQSEGAGDVECEAKPHQRPTTCRPAAVRTRLVELLPTGRSTQAHLPAGGLDQAAHPEMFPQRWHSSEGRVRRLRALGVNTRLLDLARSGRGAWRMARTVMQPALTNAMLRRYQFFMPSDLAAQ